MSEGGWEAAGAWSQVCRWRWECWQVRPPVRLSWVHNRVHTLRPMTSHTHTLEMGVLAGAAAGAFELGTQDGRYIPRPNQVRLWAGTGHSTKVKIGGARCGLRPLPSEPRAPRLSAPLISHRPRSAHKRSAREAAGRGRWAALWSTGTAERAPHMPHTSVHTPLVCCRRRPGPLCDRLERPLQCVWGPGMGLCELAMISSPPRNCAFPGRRSLFDAIALH